MANAVKVFIVDDSAVVRQVMTQVLDQDPGFQVVGSAPDPIFAQRKMQDDWPDVILLDIEMPRMDGITFLKQLMKDRPTPVVICSTLTQRSTHLSMEALSAGALEVITKPEAGLKQFLTSSAQHLKQALKGASQARLAPVRRETAKPPASSPPLTALTRTTDKVVALGTSTGGPHALEAILIRLPENCPGLVVVQHMPEKFTAAFAARLNNMCLCEVKEAAHGDRVRTGRVLIAPGGRHMVLRQSGAQYYVALQDGPPISHHKPSVDVLLRSVAQVAGRNAAGIIMTGMGMDGARGLLSMRERGSYTAAQDEQSCVVFGMPKEAIALHAAKEVLSLEMIGTKLANGDLGQ